MNRRKLTAAMTLSLLTAGFANGTEEKKTTPEKQTHCPVMQRTPIDPALYIDVKGKRVYVCCKGCMAQVRGNPDKYIKRLEDKGVVLEKTPEIRKSEEKKQTVCPVMGGKINKAQYADVNGKRIYVCCPGCIGKIKADPDTYIKQMEAEGIVLDKTPEADEHKGHE